MAETDGKIRSFSLHVTTYGETHHAGNWLVATEADVAEMKAEALVTIGLALDQALADGDFEIRLDKVEIGRVDGI